MPPRSRAKEEAITARVEASREIPQLTVDELRRIVAQAEAEGRDAVRIEVTRTASARTLAVRLRGPGSPVCLQDPPARRLAGYNWAAWWATVDLRVYLRGLDAVCRVPGCGASVDASHLMCATHWKCVGGHNQMSFYTARARAHVGKVGTPVGLEATRMYLAAALRCIFDVMCAAGAIATHDAELLVEATRRWEPARGFEKPTTGPGALAQFLELESGLGNTPAPAAVERA